MRDQPSQEASASFLKKRSKKLLSIKGLGSGEAIHSWSRAEWMNACGARQQRRYHLKARPTTAQTDEVFLLLFLQKKKRFLPFPEDTQWPA
jgi:hypothetical protein